MPATPIELSGEMIEKLIQKFGDGKKNPEELTTAIVLEVVNIAIKTIRNDCRRAIERVVDQYGLPSIFICGIMASVAMEGVAMADFVTQLKKCGVGEQVLEAIRIQVRESETEQKNGKS